MFLFLKDSKILFAGLFVFNLLNADSITQDKDSIESNENTESSETQNKNIKNYRLNAVTTISNNANKTYQSSSGFINQQMIESNPSGNGDIGSLLRILPNVQYDNSQLRSTTPGEIDPARISISGGLHYQNLFTLDGMGINNDINPVGSASFYSGAQGASQGMAIDTSLLESINILDSNVGAAYGGFTGGVIEANTRRPNKKFGANISYQITQGNATPDSISMTNYHLYNQTDSSLENFINSNSASNQPIFIKHLLKSSIESKINDNFGIIGSFTMTYSSMPLRTFAGSQTYSIDTPVLLQSTAINHKQDITRQIYNFFIKSYYDFNENVRSELTYTYAPQRNMNYANGSEAGQYHVSILGGHNLGLKTTWDNNLGVLVNTLSYSYLENSTETIGYENHQFWLVSELHNKAQWNGYVRYGSYAPWDSTQHTINNKIIQDFKPYEIWKTTHRFQVGLDLAYQYVQNSYPRNYVASSRTPRAMSEADRLACLANDSNNTYCDPTIAYATSTRMSSYAQNRLPELWAAGAIEQITYNGNTMYRLNYGQYAGTIDLYLQGGNALNNFNTAFFIEDNILFDLGKFGGINFRPGGRLEHDTYMNKVTFGHRISLNYEAPWNKSELGKNLQTQFTAGINRYYGRNIFAYALADGMESRKRVITRSDPSVSFDSILESNRMCADSTDNNCIYQVGLNTDKFKQLNVPYADEYMIGYAQSVYDFNIGAKYIFRLGRDEVRRVSNRVAGLPADSEMAATYYTYTNEGKSTTNVVTLSISNNNPLEFFGIKNYVLLAFDWTNVERNFVDYAESMSLDQLEDKDVLWDGQVVPYSQRPASNFWRPWTLRLTTTHTFNIWKTKILWNNFFRIRSEYDAIARIHTAGTSYDRCATNSRFCPNAKYDPNHNDKDQFAKQTLPLAFTWDMRFGFELDAYKGNSVYVNVDIYNILDSKNATIIAANYAGTSSSPSIGYEVGRQFWLTLGYKF